MYYNVKVSWKQPKEESDEMQKFSKGFLVYAESCTEAEGKMISWIPSNYQDAQVTDVVKTKIGDLRLKGDSETFWLIKIMEDMDGTVEKPKPFFAIYNGEHLEEAVRRAAGDTSSELDSVTRFKSIVDDELISEKVTVTRKVVAKPVDDDDDDEEYEASNDAADDEEIIEDEA